MAVIYLAHPLGDDLERNPARALAWLKFLMEREPNHAIMCPWLPFVDIAKGTGQAETSDYAKRCLRDDCSIAERCEGIVLCGPRISNGMRRELGACMEGGGFVSDLTTLTDPLLYPLDQAFAAFDMTQSIIDWGRGVWNIAHGARA